MCGIAGIVTSSRHTVRHVEAVQRMTDALTHRGPDGEGQLLFSRCLLGHRRLAIVDIEAGVQPMATPDGRVAITFNGEIYGYQDIRRELSEYPFHTKSDTEVVLALYRQHGLDFLTFLPGMFAFALWDDREQELICARDRFGEKPLYYTTGRNGEFIFASEVKGILASGLVEPVLDRDAVGRYLQRQCVAADQSIYENIKVLPPAHYLRYRDGVVEVIRYWTPPELERDIDAGEAVEQFRALLLRAVRRQLVADVPVGAFLSGGLDSSTICLLASQLKSGLRSFSFDFEGDHSEIIHARTVAKAYGTEHAELTAQHVNIADQLWRMQQVYDEPFADSSNIPTYLLCGQARHHVKVVLTGDGGDELFGGYQWYKPLLWMEKEGKIGLLRWVAARVMNRLCGWARVPGAAARELRIMGLGYGKRYSSMLAAHRGQLSFFEQCDLEQLEIAGGCFTSVPDTTDVSGMMDDVLRYDAEDYMPADILTKIDRASMAHGLELRAPFLDIDFASFCLSLPYRLKVSTSEDKIILRQAYAAQWPVSIRSRSKQGFGAPLTRWFQDSAIRELERNFLQNSNAPVYEIISYDGTQEILRRNNLMQRWTLLVLGVWMAQAQNKIHSSSGHQLSPSAPGAVGLGIEREPKIRTV